MTTVHVLKRPLVKNYTLIFTVILVLKSDSHLPKNVLFALMLQSVLIALNLRYNKNKLYETLDRNMLWE